MKKLKTVIHKDDEKHKTYALCEDVVVITDHIPKLTKLWSRVTCKKCLKRKKK